MAPAHRTGFSLWTELTARVTRRSHRADGSGHDHDPSRRRERSDTTRAQHRNPQSVRTSEDHEHTIPRTGHVTREYVRWLDRARVTTVFRWWRVCPVSTQATCGNLGGQTSGLGFPAAPPPSRRYGPAKPSSRALSSDTPKRVCLRDSGFRRLSSALTSANGDARALMCL
jgi:hypothetical protein